MSSETSTRRAATWPRFTWRTTAVVTVVAVRLFVAITYRPHFILDAGYDDGAYVSRAMMFADGHWATRFDDITFLRGPLYALYLAAVSRSGLPLPLVDCVLLLLTAWWLGHEISHLVTKTGRLTWVLFIGTAVVPIAETLTGVHVIRDTFAQYLLVATCAAGLHVVRTQRHHWQWLGATGLGIGALLITREDAIWAVPAGVALLVVVVVRDVRARAWWPIVFAVVAFGVALVGPQAVVTQLNARWGLDAATLFNDAAFTRAHQALAKYSNDGTSNPYAFTRPMYDSLVERSPSFGSIAPGFEAWQRGDDRVTYVDAIRFGLGYGLHASGQLADEHVRNRTLTGIADEIEALCVADDRTACDEWAGPPPIPVVRPSDVWAAIIRPLTGAEQLLMVEGPPSAVPGHDGSAAALREWEVITNTSPPPGSYTVVDGIVRFTAERTTAGTIAESVVLTTGRVLSPAIRIAGLLAGILLAVRRQWRLLGVGAVLLATAWIRASQVALATHFRIGDFDFHYVQPAATLVHVTALIWLGAAWVARSDRRSMVDATVTTA